jgi:hypothetical protein
MKTKKQTLTPKTEFVLYRENKISNRYTLSAELLKEGYQDWLRIKGIEWVEYYGGQTVVAYLTAKDGLNSSFEKDELPEMETLLIPVRQEFYKEMEKI